MTSYEETYKMWLISYLKNLPSYYPDKLGILNSVLVSDLRQMYIHYYKNDERALLVPYGDHTLHDTAVQKKESHYTLRYRWNVEPGNRYSEFVEGSYEIIDSIPKDTYLDRIGEPTGNYVCQLPPSGIPYTVSERALPYYLFETDLQDEWAYHRYITICDITIMDLLNRLNIFPEDTQFILRTQLHAKKIVRGTIASVKDFAEQGVGGGIQYLLPVNVYTLLKMKVLKEVPHGPVYLPNF